MTYQNGKKWQKCIRNKQHSLKSLILRSIFAIIIQQSHYGPLASLFIVNSTEYTMAVLYNVHVIVCYGFPWPLILIWFEKLFKSVTFVNMSFFTGHHTFLQFQAAGKLWWFSSLIRSIPIFSVIQIKSNGISIVVPVN